MDENRYEYILERKHFACPQNLNAISKPSTHMENRNELSSDSMDDLAVNYKRN